MIHLHTGARAAGRMCVAVYMLQCVCCNMLTHLHIGARAEGKIFVHRAIVQRSPYGDLEREREKERER